MTFIQLPCKVSEIFIFRQIKLLLYIKGQGKCVKKFSFNILTAIVSQLNLFLTHTHFMQGRRRRGGGRGLVNVVNILECSSIIFRGLAVFYHSTTKTYLLGVRKSREAHYRW